MKTAAIVFNNQSGTGLAQKYEEEIIAKVSQYFDSVSTKEIIESDDAYQYAQDARRSGVDSFFVVGGDGTISDSIQGLLDERNLDNPAVLPVPSLGIFPAGTGNGLARTLGLPLTIPKTLDSFNVVSQRYIDVGCVNGLPFVHAVTLGTLPEGIRNVSAEEKSKLGFLAYVYSELHQLGDRTRYDITITCDGQIVSDTMSSVVVYSANSLVNQLMPDHKSALDDGVLHVLALKDSSLSSILRLVPQALSKTIGNIDSDLIYLKGRSISIECTEKLDSGVDGDDGPELPLSLHIKPRYLPIYAGKTAPIKVEDEQTELLETMQFQMATS